MDARQTALLPVADRVDDEVHDDLADVMFVGQHPERRGKVVGALDRNPDAFFVGLHLSLLGDLLRQRHDVELLHFEAVHVALQLGDGIQVVDDIDQAVDALLGPLEVFAVDELVLQASVEQCRDIPLDIEDRGFELVRHVAQVLFAELLSLLEAGDLLVVRIRPRREFLADILDVLVLQLGENLVRMHVARKHDGIDRFELVSHILADDEQRHERHDDKDGAADAQRHPPHRIEQRHRPGHNGRCEERDPQRCALFGFDVYHKAYFV